jgi:hypothetical protein
LLWCEYFGSEGYEDAKIAQGAGKSLYDVREKIMILIIDSTESHGREGGLKRLAHIFCKTQPHLPMVKPKGIAMSNHKGLVEPHILLASANPQRLIKNLSHILTPDQLQLIELEINSNVRSLFLLGEVHYEFAIKANKKDWRQIVSRLYYAAYNFKRAVSLKSDGTYSTDSTDHQKIDLLPKSLDNAEAYKLQLKNLRDDRNLADYSHLAVEEDLLGSTEDATALVTKFMNDIKVFLIARGVEL